MCEVFIRNSRTDRYNIMFSIDAHEKENQQSSDYVRSGGGCPLPKNSTTEALDPLGENIDFIGCWIKDLEHNFIELFNLYYLIMDLLFKKIPAENGFYAQGVMIPLKGVESNKS